VLAWPEELESEAVAALETVMSECDKEAQRIVFAAVPGPEFDALLERYAWKAMTFGFPAVDEAPPLPLGPARFVVAPADRFDDTRRRVLDALDPETDDVLVVSPCPPSRSDAEAVVAKATPEHPVIFVVEAYQLPWLRRHFHPLAALRLPAAADLAERRAEKVRAALAAQIEAGDLDRELLQIAPLLDRYDPADIAAAALRAARAGLLGALGAQTAAPQPEAVSASGVPSWAKLWIGVGRKDGVKPGDLVGAMVGEAKVAADRIGKIDLRELFALVEVRAEDAQRIAEALTGTTLRGRRLTAHIDRGAGPARPPRRG
jgi:hypothetical protein